MKIIHYIRHGRIILPEGEKRFFPDDELHLDSLNDQEMIIIDNYLKRIPDYSCIFTSTIARTIETAKLFLNKNSTLTTESCSELDEFFPRCLMGKYITELESEYGPNCVSLYYDDPVVNNFFSVDETFHEAFERISSFFRAKLSGECNEIWLVGHGTLHSIFIIGLLAGAFNRLYTAITFSNLYETIVAYDEDKDAFTLEKINA
ncbi:hypothetical protein FACS1894122_06680 [Alphaproteobacteria bacterium]|nr:hypothetical protein FACS1894122_06680 [Alphaproteobacteria bacterium]